MYGLRYLGIACGPLLIITWLYSGGGLIAPPGGLPMLLGDITWLPPDGDVSSSGRGGKARLCIVRKPTSTIFSSDCDVLVDDSNLGLEMLTPRKLCRLLRSCWGLVSGRVTAGGARGGSDLFALCRKLKKQTIHMS